MAGSRAIYLIVAIVAIGVLSYQSHLGGVLVYDYGAGTALMAAAPVPSETASPGAAATSAAPLPTVTVPTALATPMAPPVSAAPASPGDTGTPTPSPTAQPTGAVNM
jgi:hypothetical protein